MRLKARSLTGCKTSLFLLAVLGTLGMAGCYGSVERLDQRVAEMIAERQRLALGQQGVSDASVAAPGNPNGNALYDEQPTTNNPSADKLPAKSAVDTGIDSVLKQAEISAERIELDLPAFF